MNILINEINNVFKIVKGIAMQFGKNCEVVLHDYRKPLESTIIAIENGHVTGRKVGDCGSNLGLEVLAGTSEFDDHHNYITHKNGRILRSSSIFLRDHSGKVIGCICINFDITDLMMAKAQIEDITYSYNDTNVNFQIEETISADINDVLDALIQKSLQVVNIPVANMTKEDKMKGLSYLDSKGAFLIKKAADRIAKFYDISRFSLYSYLDQCRAEKRSKAVNYENPAGHNNTI